MIPGPVSLFKCSKTQCYEPTVLESRGEARLGPLVPARPHKDRSDFLLLWISKSSQELIKKQILLPCPRAALPSQGRVCVFNKSAGWIRCITRHWRHKCAAMTCQMSNNPWATHATHEQLYCMFSVPFNPWPNKNHPFISYPSATPFCGQANKRSLKYKRYILQLSHKKAPSSPDNSASSTKRGAYTLLLWK